MVWNTLKCQKCRPIHFIRHFEDVTNDAQLMTKSVVHDALFQAMPHIKHTLIQFFGVVKFCLVYDHI